MRLAGAAQRRHCLQRQRSCGLSTDPQFVPKAADVVRTVSEPRGKGPHDLCSMKSPAFKP